MPLTFPAESSIGTRIQLCREHYAWSQRELAAQLTRGGQIKVSSATVCRWEQDKRVPLLTQAVALARVFGVPLDDLVPTALRATLNGHHPKKRGHP